MISFEEYSQPVTSSGLGADHQSYQYDGPLGQGYSPVYIPHSQSTTPTFGAYFNHHHYPRSTHQNFVLDTDSAQQQVPAKRHLHHQSPAHSPAQSAANSLDLQPPVLSSTSDSGTSIRSSLSSGIESPSMNIYQSHEWNQFPGTVPSIVHQDSFHPDSFAHFEFEPSMQPKHLNCVGKSAGISSSPCFVSIHSLQTMYLSLHHDWTVLLDTYSGVNVKTKTTKLFVTSAWPILSCQLSSCHVVPMPRHPNEIVPSFGYHHTNVPLYCCSPWTLTDIYLIDPSLIRPNSPTPYTAATLHDIPTIQHHDHPFLFAQQPSSPALSGSSVLSNSGPSPRPTRRSRTISPYRVNPYPMQPPSRRPSVSSVQSHHSQQSRNSQSSLDSSEEGRGICPIASCGRHIKDLKAHLLTHKNERPEKCPIISCEYHTKGFARKYDKNRHTLTHYKGTMVCGFCPGSGSSLEKSFNRADVFKRHLTSVHGVEQTAPNSRKKSPGNNDRRGGYDVREASGTCSTCGVVFANAQDFYEHLDDCVLRVVQQGDPSEAINERLLTSIAQDKAVRETMERHMLSTTLDFTASTNYDQEEEDEDNEEKHDLQNEPGKQRQSTSQGGKHQSSIFDSRSGRQGMTHSKGGVALNPTAKGNKRRKNYPISWGATPEKMKMKKRVICVFDGPRRLWKDDMMLDSKNEVRVTLPGGDGRHWITDLDIQTLRRTEGLHGATEEEKGPWLDEEGCPVDFHNF